MLMWKFNTPWFSFVHNCQKSGTNSGVAMYISEEFEFKQSPDLRINIEGGWVG